MTHERRSALPWIAWNFKNKLLSASKLFASALSRCPPSNVISSAVSGPANYGQSLTRWDQVEKFNVGNERAAVSATRECGQKKVLMIHFRSFEMLDPGTGMDAYHC